ncbi:MAG: hypothetical protein LUD44_08250 [Firmicutes bacterium]|nr:hypothetical protein [Bacillota bacterium]MCD8315605.1 hypothetical protein [Bacillota bacterium]
MSKRKIAFFLSLVFISFIVIFYFYPIQIPQNSERYYITVIYDDIEIDNFAAFPVGTSVTAVVECSDNHFADIDSAISSLRYSRCFHTFISDYLPKSEQNTDSELIFCETEDISILLSGAGNHVVIDGEVYRISSSSDLYYLYQLCKEAVDNINTDL